MADEKTKRQAVDELTERIAKSGTPSDKAREMAAETARKHDRREQG